MRKLTELEEMAIKVTDKDKYNVYICDEDGIFSVLKSKEEQVCPYCKKECEQYA